MFVTFLEGLLLVTDDLVSLVREVQSEQLETLLDVEVLEVAFDSEDHSFFGDFI